MTTNARQALAALFTGVSILTLAACTKPNAQTQASESHDDEGSTEQNRIDIPSTVRSNLGITFAKVERRQVESTIRIPGAFELQPLARREYRMTLPGQIELAVDQYQRVAPGDLLFRYRSPQWPELQHEIILSEQDIESAQASIDVARARIDEAEHRLAIMNDRLSSLKQAQVRNADLEAQASEVQASIPRLHAELRQAETSLANAHRTREHAIHRASTVSGIAESKLIEPVEHKGESQPVYRMIDSIEVRATHPGVVELLAQTDGSYADAPSLVLSTVDTTKVRFRALALQTDLARLIDAPLARIVPPNVPGVEPGDWIEASVAIGLEAHPEQRTVTLIATTDASRPWVRPGVSAFLEVVTSSTSGPSLAIPRAAILKDGIVHVFFRRDPKDPNKAIRVEADMGVSDGRWVAINSGLAPNDEVILDGAYELKLASEQSGITQKGGHFHADGTFHNESEEE